jgi:hypothetical protein
MGEEALEKRLEGIRVTKQVRCSCSHLTSQTRTYLAMLISHACVSHGAKEPVEHTRSIQRKSFDLASHDVALSKRQNLKP